ncbi:MAG: Ppx/GppA family phosphatase, partial [Muribaculaceae bacterium]|nr:Ppx/GppA family phosphatase [Muribaculaceae bacterium]
MKDTTFAAIDIGSNAVRLLIKRYEEEDDNLKKLMLLRVPLRLGFDVFTKGKVSAKKAENLLRLMKAYRQLMKIYSVDELRACATSAMRDAENGPELIKEVLDKTGIKIEIIAGEEEARIVYNNHMEYQGDRKGNFLYVDVG